LAAVVLLGYRSSWFSDPATSARALRFLWGFLGLGTAYAAYLVIDAHVVSQTAPRRALRSASPFIFLLLYYPLLVRSIPFVARVQRAIPASYPAWLTSLKPPLSWIAVDWLCITYFTFVPYVLLSIRHYHFHKYLHFQRFARGTLLCVYAAILTIIFIPAMGSAFPPIVPPDAMGLLSCVFTRVPVSRMVMNAFPTIVVTLTVYFALFDFLHHRDAFYVMLLPAASAVASAVFLRGYPVGAVAANVLMVILVLLYMRILPMSAHDGRLI
jgi:hypothetical protein